MSFSKYLFGALLLAASNLPAQDSGGAPPALIRLNVVALDANGQPVTDLTADELKITDQGKPQTLLLFHNSCTETPAPAGARDYSNRPGGVMPHSAAILFDLMNENQADRLTVWHDLDRSLAQLETGDGVYLYLLNLEGAVVPIHGIGGKGGDHHTWPKEIDKLLDKEMKGASHARPVHIGSEDIVKKTYVALETLANLLATLPGRRDIIWITNGMPNVWNPKLPCNGDWVDCALYVPHLGVTLDKDQAAVNPLSYSSDLTPDVNRDLEQMAAMTGGRPYYREDIRDVLKQVARDATDSYSVAYEPSSENWDNKFHKIHLATEHKGVKLNSRTRYYALPDSRSPAMRQQNKLVAAYQAAYDLPDVGLVAKVAPAVDQKMQLEIRVRAADVLLREQAGKYNGGVTFVLANFGATGPAGEPALSNLNLSLTREQRDSVMKGGIPISRDHAVPAGVERVKIIVLDQATNAVGSLTVPVR